MDEIEPGVIDSLNSKKFPVKIGRCALTMYFGYIESLKLTDTLCRDIMREIFDS